MNPVTVHQWMHEGLTWIGFGMVSGLLAKAIMPGRDPGGAMVTLILGLVGALIGGAIYAWSVGEYIRNLISPLGFAAAVGGSMILLLANRLFTGRIPLDDDRRGVRSPYYRNRRRTRVIDD